MQVKNATAALSTANHAGGKASSKANGAEDQGFAALMSVLGTPLSESSTEISAKPAVGEGEQGQGEGTAEGDEGSIPNEMSDLERATAASSVSPVAVAPMPVVAAPVATVEAPVAVNPATVVAPTPVAPTAPESQVVPAEANADVTPQPAASADAAPQVVSTADQVSQIAADLAPAFDASPATPTVTSALQTSLASASAAAPAATVSNVETAAATSVQPQLADAAPSTDSAPVAERPTRPTPPQRPVVPAQPSVEHAAAGLAPNPARPASPASPAFPAFRGDVRPLVRPAFHSAAAQRLEATLPFTAQPTGSSVTPALPLEAFHVEQLAVTPVAGPYAPVNPVASAAMDEGAMWETASLSGARLGVGRPRLDALQNLGLEMQGVVRGGLRVAAQASRAKVGSDPSRDSRTDAAAALATTTAPPQTAEGGVVSSSAPVPLPSLVPEIVRTAAQLSDALKKGNPAGSNVVELRLDPPALGAITVRVVEERGVVNAFVTCANPAMQKVLAAEMTHLSTNLAHHGIALGQVSVGTEGGGQQSFGHKPDAAETEITPTGRRAPPTAPAAPSRAAPRSAMYEGRAVNARA